MKDQANQTQAGIQKIYRPIELLRAAHEKLSGLGQLYYNDPLYASLKDALENANDGNSELPPARKPVTKGSIVRYGDGHYRVTAVIGQKVNLGQIFGSHIYHKGVPITDVFEDEAAWHEAWTKSESYQSM